MMGNDAWGNGMWAGHGLWMLVIAVLMVIPAWRICQRVGYPGVMGLLILVPLLNLGLLYFLAFSDWPANKKEQE
ncbi:hypothetical protein [Marinobacter sp. CHS3-4]|uniref:hypothetical protein n=1 Tax=Marinobacter sp. CHS3-4 TaxID=3045174 RepID=UPI0024B4E5D8|nr:hypothetical protein [Marinobacter sp. CHS3-4]MDI9245126.1 hypothetical protein [Marinobacter sp. CHS3-4]